METAGCVRCETIRFFASHVFRQALMTEKIENFVFVYFQNHYPNKLLDDFLHDRSQKL